MSTSKPTLTPCHEWSEKLSKPIDDLSPSERAELEEHVASCPACSVAQIDYKMIGDLLRRSLPMPDFPPGLPSRLQQMFREECQNKEIVQYPVTSYTNIVEEQEKEAVSPFDYHCLASANSEKPDISGSSQKAQQKDEEEPLASEGGQIFIVEVKTESRGSREETRAQSSRVEGTYFPAAHGFLWSLGKILVVLLGLLFDKHSRGYLQISKLGRQSDRVLLCRNCGQRYSFAVNEQNLNQAKGLKVLPSQFPSWQGTHTFLCIKCGNTFQVSLSLNEPYPNPRCCSSCQDIQHNNDAHTYGGRASKKDQGYQLRE